MTLSNVIALNIFVTFLLTVTAKNSEKVLLGTVNGKAYITNSEPRDWTDARLFCEINGMELASITSEEEARFLKAAFDPLNFNGCWMELIFWYWIGATGNKTDIATFKWIKNDKKIEKIFGLDWKNETYVETESTCLSYAASEDVFSYYFPLECFQPQRTLCESYHSVQQEKGVKESDLISFGTVDSKTFYVDGIKRSWNGSMSFCERNGLKLANVTSWTQATFLKEVTMKSSYEYECKHTWFWIVEQFGRQMFPTWNGNGETSLCPYFSAHNGVSFRRACYHWHLTLCESH